MVSRSLLDIGHPRHVIKDVGMVLHDMHSYLHPSWHRALELPSHASPRLVNQLLHIWLNEREVSMRDVTEVTSSAHLVRDLLHTVRGQNPHSAPLIRCLTEWRNLEGILYLLGAHASHASLTAAGRLPFLRWQAGAFISVPAARPGFMPDLASFLPENRDRDNTLALDVTLYRLGASIIATAFGTAQSLLIRRLGLLLPHAAYDAFLRPLPRWRGNARQATFLIDLASAFQRASARTANHRERKRDV